MHLESRGRAPGTVNLRLGAVRRLASSLRLRSPKLRLGCRDTARQGREETWRQNRQLVDRRAGQALWQAPERERLKRKRDRALLAV